MKVHQETIRVRTRGQGFTDLTEEIAAVALRAGIGTGLATAFLKHTSASLVIQENADPAVLRDLGRWVAGVAPESERYEHDAEGPDDMPAHLRSAMGRSSESIPISGGTLALGTWQAVYLWEHRRGAHTREIVVHVCGI